MNYLQDIASFFNTTFFGSLSTLITVGGAVLIYTRQQKSNKQQIGVCL